MALFLDTETTGLSPAAGDSVVEIAIVDAAGRTVIDTLVNPGRAIPWQATKVHGITDEMVRRQPTLNQLMPRIRQIVSKEIVVIYNSSFDAPFFPGQLREALAVECAMRRFTAATGGGRWKKLDVAARHAGHRWTGDAHRALADALACRSVWSWLERSSTVDNERGIERSSPESIPGFKTTVLCPKCAILLRVPSGKLLDITCPTCRRTFRHQT